MRLDVSMDVLIVFKARCMFCVEIILVNFVLKHSSLLYTWFVLFINLQQFVCFDFVGEHLLGDGLRTCRC